ncbi:MAG: InlB B-repeat-containing protein, partial [Coriobacteriales bacterium]|nr:InlB B-repeat-containing protein [Coriobacteriales bacterium]
GWDALGWSATDVQDSASFASIVGSDQVLLLALQAQWSPKTVEVTFDAAGGTPTSPASITVTFDAPYGALPSTTQTGYVFDGWFDAPTGGTQVVAATVVSNAVNHTLYAHWHPAGGIVLVFDKNAADATAGTPAQWNDLVFGQTLAAQGKTLPVAGGGAPERYGYDFIGWASSQALADAGTADFTSGALVDWTTSKTVYAVWQAKTVDVTFDPTGGSATSPSQITVTFDQPYGSLPSTTQAGYVFDGWFDAPTGGTQVVAATVVNNASSHTLYAHWHPAGGIVLVFDSNAANATPGTITHYDDLVYGQTLTAQGKSLPAAGSGAPTRTGYNFLGWATTQTLAGAGTADFTNGALVDWTTSKTVYAVWQAKTMLVTFDPTGGSATSPAQLTATFDQPYGALPSTAKTSSVFDGWFDAPTGGTQVVATTVVSNASNHTLYAYWHSVDDIVLTFDKNATDATAGGVTRWDDLIYEQTLAGQGKNLPVAGSGAPTRNGYDFVGWASSQALANAGAADVTNGSLVDWPSSTSKTVYAVWRAKAVDVRFYNNYTSGDTSQYAPGNAINGSKRYGDSLSLFAAPTRSGYTFTGWYDARSGGRYWDFDAWGINVHPTLNLYAQWRAQPIAPAARVTILPPTVIHQVEVIEQAPLMISVRPDQGTDIPAPQIPTAPPAATPQGHWSLANLDLAIVAAFILGLLLLNRKKKIPALTPMVALATVVSVVLFLLTQDLSQPMQLVDTWTILHVIIVAVQLGVWFLLKNSGEEEQEQPSV